MLLAHSGLPDILWSEAIHHRNWLQNLLPSKLINNYISVSKRRPNVNVVNFFLLPTFGLPCFVFLYRSSSAANKKLLAREIHICFVEMESDERLWELFDPTVKKIFHCSSCRPQVPSSKLLPPISKILERLYHPAKEDHCSGTVCQAEDRLH